MLRAWLVVVTALITTAVNAQSSSVATPTCDKPVYLTIDTGNMEPAEAMAEILRKHNVKATFFLANEKTKRGDTTLDSSWAAFWKRLVDDGHEFGSHTWKHWYFRGDVSSEQTRYVAWGAKTADQQTSLNAAQVCEELKRPESAFKQMTGRSFSPIWRAPGGKTTPNVLRWASACGFEHVAWSDAGFSGDELPSHSFPSDALIAKQLRNIKGGDVLLWHLGIWVRKDPLWPRLDELVAGLKAKGFCFRRISERPKNIAQ